jgi:hypothetical protein
VAGGAVGSRVRRACGGAAGTTRFGERVPARLGATSFRCGECGEVAGVVRVAPGGGADDFAAPSSDAAGWVVLRYFLCTVWHPDTSDVLDAVQALIDQGAADPVVIREVSWTLWDITPFYCPECRLNYCNLDWDVRFVVCEGSHDCILGTCPKGHRHLLG